MKYFGLLFTLFFFASCGTSPSSDEIAKTPDTGQVSGDQEDTTIPPTTLNSDITFDMTTPIIEDLSTAKSSVTFFPKPSNDIQIEQSEDTIKLANSRKSITGIRDGNLYRYTADFINDYNNLKIRCISPADLLDEMVLTCTVDDKYTCTSIIVRKDEKKFVLDNERSDCSAIINSFLVPNTSSSLVKNLSVGKGGPSIITHSPELCYMITKHPVEDANITYTTDTYTDTGTGTFYNEIAYALDYSLNDFNDTNLVLPFNNTPSDGKKLLTVKQVFSTTNHEGCLNYVVGEYCNGPWGNFHIKVTPVINFPLTLTAPDEYTKNYIIGMTSIHLILQGAFLSDNGQCEWYDEEVVGSQRVYYNKKYIWDFDTFFMFIDKFEYEYMPVRTDTVSVKIWESDEGFMDDDIVEIIVKETDLKSATYFGNDDFGIELEISDANQ